MNVRLLPVWFAVVSIAVAGCGGTDICDRIFKSHAALVSKTAACGLDQGTFDVAACKSNEKSCTGGEIDAYTRAYDCLDKLPACVAGQGSAYAQSEQQCTMGAQASQTCSQALGVH